MLFTPSGRAVKISASPMTRGPFGLIPNVFEANA